MKKTTISIIAAIGKNRELGKNNKLLWDIPEDLQHFRKTTAGHPIIMGRKTYESIGRPLPKRPNIIITRNQSFTAKGCIVCNSIKEAVKEAQKNDDEIFIIGGAQIYKQALIFTDKLYLTVIDASFNADTYFPNYSKFKKVISQEKSSDNNYSYTFFELKQN